MPNHREGGINLQVNQEAAARPHHRAESGFRRVYGAERLTQAAEANATGGSSLRCLLRGSRCVTPDLSSEKWRLVLTGRYLLTNAGSPQDRSDADSQCGRDFPTRPQDTDYDHA